MKVTIEGQDFDMLTIKEFSVHNIGAPDGASLASGFANMYMTAIVEQLAEQNRGETLHFLASLATNHLKVFFDNYGIENIDDILAKIKTKLLQLNEAEMMADAMAEPIDEVKPC